MRLGGVRARAVCLGVLVACTGSRPASLLAQGPVGEHVDAPVLAPRAEDEAGDTAVRESPGALAVEPEPLVETPESDRGPNASNPGVDGGARAGVECRVLDPGCYRDVDGTLRDARSAYRAMRPRVEAHPWKALGWNGAFLAIGTTWYWLARKQNAVDWDVGGWRSRFTRSAFRYDNNAYPINFVYHPMSGAAFYTFARANEVGILASAAYAVGTSFAWEFAIEFRERLAVNDLLVTGNTGIVIGEFFYQLGRYFTSAPGGGGRRQRALAWSLGLPVAMHDHMHGRARPDASMPRDALGFSADYWHRFRVSGGAVALTPSAGPGFRAAEIDASGEIVSIPGYLREGEFRHGFADGDRTRFRLRGLLGGGGPGWDIESDAVLAGFYRQRIRSTPGGLRGHATLVGVDLGYVYRHQRLAHFADSWSSFRLPGLALEHHFVAEPVTIRVGAEANVDFTGAYAVGGARWVAQHRDEQGKEVVALQNYYFGWGFSARGHLLATMPLVELQLDVVYAYVNSREGLSRAQEIVTNDQLLHDSLLDVEATVRIVPFDGIFVQASVLRQGRHSVIDSIVDDRHLLRTSFAIGVVR